MPRQLAANTQTSARTRRTFPGTSSTVMKPTNSTHPDVFRSNPEYGPRIIMEKRPVEEVHLPAVAELGVATRSRLRD